MKRSGIAALVVGLVAIVALSQFARSSGPAAAPRATAGEVIPEVVRTALPSGQRQALYDPATRTLWVLSRGNADNAVLLTSVASDGAVSTSKISGEGADWTSGALAVFNGQVWTAWGAHLFAFDPKDSVTRAVAVPWHDGTNGMEGRVAAVTAAGGCLWIAVIGEPQVRCFQPPTGTWREVASPDQRPVSMFTRLAADGADVVANLGAPADSLAIAPATNGVSWAPENVVPVAGGVEGKTAAVGATWAAIATVSGAIPPSGQPPVTMPTSTDGQIVARVSAADGALIIDYADLADGTAWTRTVPMPQIEVSPRYAPVGSKAQLGWLSPKIGTIAVEPGGAVWAISDYGDDAPGGWGAVLRLPAT